MSELVGAVGQGDTTRGRAGLKRERERSAGRPPAFRERRSVNARRKQSSSERVRPHSLKWDERRCVLGMQAMSSAKEGAETREEAFGGRGEGDWELEGDGWEARRGEATAMNGNGKLALAVDYDCCHSIMSAKLPDELAYSWWSTSRLEVGVGDVVSN
ncbi:hypothetical protein BT69DRAFT_1296156 [Atractiella rhizophila]|nr:hypothetical protein BT69DRAFT_1296156 [Atractiella rhizophila]